MVFEMVFEMINLDFEICKVFALEFVQNNVKKGVSFDSGYCFCANILVYKLAMLLQNDVAKFKA